MFLPLLPLRGTCVMPGAVVELQVGRPGSVAALSRGPGARLLVIKQRDATRARPSRVEHFHDTGTLAELLSTRPSDQGRHIVRLRGVDRATLLAVRPQMLALQGQLAVSNLVADAETHDAMRGLYQDQLDQGRLLPALTRPDHQLYALLATLSNCRPQHNLDSSDFRAQLSYVLTLLDEEAGMEWVQ